MILESLLMVTVLAMDLESTAAAYSDYLGYEVLHAGVIQKACAEQMGDPSLADRDYINMSPPKGEKQVILRFVQGASASYKPMLSSGWSAIELLAQNPDSLRDQMITSPFRVVGEPAYLTAAEKIYAMQALGPSGELLYLTQMLDPASSLLKPVTPKAAIGNTFIMVAGSPDLSVTRLFLEKTFENFVTNPVPFKIDVLSKARGDRSDTRYPIMMMKFSGPFGFEFDQYGKELDREKIDGGIILVSSSVDDFNNITTSWERNSVESSCPGIDGKSGLVRFPSGALLEVISH
jgi:hypothetical protein|tara:strand:- start:6422 stop:7294 length:873 start_codon:yes stop_codon:yes gene_type:complete